MRDAIMLNVSLFIASSLRVGAGLSIIVVPQVRVSLILELIAIILQPAL
jgi:hypothetical protein